MGVAVRPAVCVGDDHHAGIGGEFVGDLPASTWWRFPWLALGHGEAAYDVAVRRAHTGSMALMSDKLARLRASIEKLPETSEKLSHGAPTWWGGKKTFATYHSGSYDEGREGVWIKAPEGVQETLVSGDPRRFYRPKYLGPAGWIGVRLDGDTDWGQVELLLVEGYRLVAPKRALKKLDGEVE